MTKFQTPSAAICHATARETTTALLGFIAAASRAQPELSERSPFVQMFRNGLSPKQRAALLDSLAGRGPSQGWAPAPANAVLAAMAKDVPVALSPLSVLESTHSVRVEYRFCGEAGLVRQTLSSTQAQETQVWQFDSEVVRQAWVERAESAAQAKRLALAAVADGPLEDLDVRLSAAQLQCELVERAQRNFGNEADPYLVAEHVSTLFD